MKFLKKNYGWLLVAILAILPLIPISNLIDFDNIFQLKVNDIENTTDIEMLYHITGEFAIRWLTAVLSCTPFFILFGVYNLFVRQAMGIVTAFYSILHFIFFIWAEGFAETFTETNYIAGFIAVLILIPLFLTSNRKSMKKLKAKWKKLQSLSYLAVVLSLLHVALLDKTWLIYAIIVSIGFIMRIPPIRAKLVAWRKRRN